MIEKPRPDLLTLSTTFYDLPVLRNLFSKVKIRQFGESGTEGLRPKKTWSAVKTKISPVKNDQN